MPSGMQVVAVVLQDCGNKHFKFSASFRYSNNSLIISLL